MSNLDVEALLEAAEKQANDQHAVKKGQEKGTDTGAINRQNGSKRDLDRGRDDNRTRDRDARDRRHPDHRDEDATRSDSGSNSSRVGGPGSRDSRLGYNARGRRDGDFYRGGRGRGRGRSRSRSRSPRRYNNPRDDRDRRDRRDRYEHRDRNDRPDRRSTEQGRGGDRRSRTPTLNEDERDRRTVFVQQLANRLRTDRLKKFFDEHAGPVNEAQIVKDRVSGRSKGVGYVEFKDEESVQKALQLTGRLLENIPIIVRVTEAEKNRQVRKTEDSGGNANAATSFHRLYIGNIHFNVTQEDLEAVFEPFGELDFAQLQLDDNKRSKGFGFVQYKEAQNAREALEKMNGFELAGRPIRVGLGNDRSGPDSANSNRGHGQNANFQGSAFSGAGGRGPASAFDRAGGRDNDRTGGGGALDDSDVAGVNFNNYSRDALMRKLARTDEASTGKDEAQVLKPKTETKPLPVNVNMASRCVVLRNMFDPENEEGDSWIKELEDDIRDEAEKQYGHVVHISLDANSKGDVYLKFDKVQGGENAIKGLNGRYFGGRMINASPVVDAVYSSLFSRTRAI
ncbi:RNA-binding protein rsd1 [Tolypocladium ophioglossoides CBS 100239]|uniref:RNA-binding protein rsd1 n=1 Tax=Tolypocladium ophioglossoides (strain CBS 100239) TaxID=1163406 RepID=A0A0L0NJZ1_TOLOC|nr:RNA-binding protein rsd1 [Tolypocladium ophioglossoides CBS 100239]